MAPGLAVFFTTGGGSTHGYDLTGVTFAVGQGADASEVKLHRRVQANDPIGAELMTFTNPSPWGTNKRTWVVPGGSFVLEPRTTYAIVLRSTEQLHLRHTSSDAEDADGAIGFSIGDTMRRLDNSMVSQNTLRTRIEGTVRTTPADTTAPTVTSVTRAGPDAVDADGQHRVSWVVNFSEDVQNVDADDFVITDHAGTTYTPNTDDVFSLFSDSQYFVQLSSTPELDIETAQTTLTLTIVDDHDIADEAGNALANPDLDGADPNYNWFRVNGGPPPEPPATPTNLRVTAVSTTMVTLEWDAVPGATSYEVRDSPIADWTDSGADTTHTFVFVPNDRRNLDVRAVNAGGASDRARLSTQSLPPAPTGLTTSAVMATSVTLSWERGITSGANYQVRADAGDDWASAGQNATSHRFTGLTPDTTYTLEVRAVNDFGGESSVASVDVTTLQAPAIPHVTAIERLIPPTRITAADRLTWRVTFSEDVDAATVAPADFAVSVDGTASTTVTFFVPPSSNPTTVFTVTVSGGELAPGMLNRDSSDDSYPQVALGFAADAAIATPDGTAFDLATVPATNQAYDVDNTGPQVEAIRRITSGGDALASPNNVDEFRWLVTFTDSDTQNLVSGADYIPGEVDEDVFTFEVRDAAGNQYGYTTFLRQGTTDSWVVRVRDDIGSQGQDISGFDGELTLHLPDDLFIRDAADNPLTSLDPVGGGDDQRSMVLDNTAPTVAIAARAGKDANAAPVTTVGAGGTFVAHVTLTDGGGTGSGTGFEDFDATDITATGATVGNDLACAAADTSPRLCTVTVTADNPFPDGRVTVSVAASAFTDGAGNENEAATPVTVTEDDATAPDAGDYPGNRNVTVSLVEDLPETSRNNFRNNLGASDRSVVVSWNIDDAFDDEDATYQVERSDDGGASFTVLGTESAEENGFYLDNDALGANERREYRITLLGAGGNPVAASAATVSIIGTQQAPPVVAIAGPAAAVAEGADLTFTVSLADSAGDAQEAPAGGLDVSYMVAAASTAAAGDYTAPSGTLSIPAGQSSAQITVATTDDDLFDLAEEETVVLTLTDGTGYALDSDATRTTATGTITDPDTLTLRVPGTLQVSETAASVEATITPSRMHEGTIAIDYATADGTAMAPGDYAGASGTVTLPTDSGRIALTVADDALVEGDETFTLTYSNVRTSGGRTVGFEPGSTIAATTTVTITSEDAATPVLTVVSIERAGPATENADSATAVSWRVTFSAAPMNVDAADFRVANHTGTAWAISNVMAQLGSPETYVVEVANDPDDAPVTTAMTTLTLTIASGHDIADAAGGALANADLSGVSPNENLFVLNGGPPPPAMPTGLAASAVTDTSATLGWTKVAGATRYEVNGGVLAGWTDAGDVASYVFTGLSAETDYTLEVRAVNARGPSPAAQTTVRTLAPPPAAPTGLGASADSQTQATLTWAAVSGATGYEVLGGALADWTDAGNVTSYVFAGLTADTAYTLQVRAVNAAGPSAAAQATVTTLPNAPGAPTGLTVTELSPTAATLSWTAPAGATRHEVNGGGLAGWTDSETDTSHTFTGLTPNVPHTLQVRAANAGGESAAASVQVTVTVTGNISIPAGAEVDLPRAVATATVVFGEVGMPLPDDHPRFDFGPALDVSVTGHGGEAVRVCLPAGDLPGRAGGRRLVLAHFIAGAWTTVPRSGHDAGAMNVCGSVTKFSPFAAALLLDDPEARTMRVSQAILPQAARAMTDAAVSAITGRLDSLASGGGAAVPGTAAGLLGLVADPDVVAALGAAAEDGTDPVRLLDGRILAMMPDAGGAGFWAGVDYASLGGSDGAVDWDGELKSVHLGADRRLRPGLTAGLALSRSRGDFRFADSSDGATVRGTYDTRMTSLHPYIGLERGGGTGLWATLGLGRGRVEIGDDVAGTRGSDAHLRSLAAGGTRDIRTGAGGRSGLRLKLEAMAARLDVEGSGSAADRVPAQDVDARRLRVAMEAWTTRSLERGDLRLGTELGLRHDGGDGPSGRGVELGGSLGWRNGSGLSADVRGRVLLAHDADLDEWGVSGTVRLDRTVRGRGLTMSLASSYGDAASGADRLWRNGLAGNGGGAGDGQDMSLDLDVGYGLRAGRMLVTPYGALDAGDGSRRYALGGRFGSGPGPVDLRVERRERADGRPVHGILLEFGRTF